MRLSFGEEGELGELPLVGSAMMCAGGEKREEGRGEMAGIITFNSIHSLLLFVSFKNNMKGKTVSANNPSPSPLLPNIS